jgi:hypothetical protein
LPTSKEAKHLVDAAEQVNSGAMHALQWLRAFSVPNLAGLVTIIR